MDRIEIAQEKLSEFYKAHFCGKIPNIDPSTKNGQSFYVELSKDDAISLWYEWWNEQKENYFAISVDFDSEKELEDAAKKHGVIIPKDENIWSRKNVVCDRISYQGEDVGPRGGVRDKYAYMTQYMPSDASWIEYEKCLDRFFNHTFVRKSKFFKMLVAQRIIANMNHMLSETSLRLVNENKPIGTDKNVLFIQYKPSFAEETWRYDGCHYEFRITDEDVFVEFHSESNAYKQDDIYAVGLPLSLKKWGKKGFRLFGQNEEIKFSPENSQDGFVDKAVNRMIEFEKDYGGKILKLIGQEDRSMINKTLELLKSNYNIILHGAPGTGKTYLAKQIAKALIFGDENKELSEEEQKQFDEQFGFVQFHQSYDYTDFVEGLRPVNSDSGNVNGFERKNGSFKDFCSVALLSDGLKNAYCTLVKKIRNKELESFNQKTGMSINVKGIDDYNNIVLQSESEAKKDEPKVKYTITYDALKKILEKYKTSKSLDEISNIKEDIRNCISDDNSSSAWINSSAYWAVAKYLINKIQKKFIFVIDEINRGEMSKIFGELFFSIDSGYRGERGRIKTQYQNLVKKGDEFEKGFFVPENVYIIGTMNDIDRSVESMDFAMRRRFAFEEITAEQSMKMFDDPKSWKNENNDIVKIPENVLTHLKNRMKNLNTAILEPKFNLGQTYQIGGAYFLKFAKYFESYGEYGAFAELWNNHLKGLLSEYLRSMSKAKDLLEQLQKEFEDEGSR